ncbi:response regulator [Flavobacterium sp.]|uniref:response regulator n=1 Tax=Flavobacterium sp. TaxID=239 RepID=UPI0028BD526C|nr:response regulator [Flavobacterium sp.]
MQKELNILIVDDHPFIIEAYINLITLTLEGYRLNFLKSSRTKEAYNIIKLNYIDNKKIDVAIFDISIPEYKEKRIYDGCDLAVEFKNNFTESKVIMISMHFEGCIINKAFRDVEADGIINKSDINFDTFSEAFTKILANEIFISDTMIKSLTDFNNSRYKFDQIDGELIRLIDKGIKTKDLPQLIGISLSSIEKRKKEIKYHLLNGKKGNDDDLIEKAKQLKLV